MHLHFGLPVGPGTHLLVIFELVTVGPWNTLLTFLFSFTSPLLSSSFLPAPFMHLHFGLPGCPGTYLPVIFEFVTVGPWNNLLTFSSPLPLLLLPTCSLHFAFWAACGPRNLPAHYLHSSLSGPGIPLSLFSFSSPSPSYLLPSCICILGCLWAQDPTCPLYLNSSLSGPGILFSLFFLLYLSFSFLPAPFMHLNFGLPVGPGTQLPVIFEFVTVGPWNILLTVFFSFTSLSPSYLLPSCI
jgi:hypothetical protein